MMKRLSLEDREALGAFLLTRRNRLRPDDFGFPAEKRRTPGLRREEVAQLAGVSVSWYTWIEQGRDISVSADALERLSTALRLNDAERDHVFALSSRQTPRPRTSGGEVSDSLLALLQQIDPVPAYIRNECLDVLAWNPAVADLFIDYGKLQPFERNILRLAFLNAEFKSVLPSWETFAHGMLRVFCAARAKASDKLPFERLLEDLQALSPEFRAWWPEGDVEHFDEGHTGFYNPRSGRLDLIYLALAPDGQSDLSLVMYLVRPSAGDETLKKP